MKSKSKNKRVTEDLRDDESLDEVSLNEGLVAAGLDVGGTLSERAVRLEAHYLALPEPDGWDESPAAEGGDGSWLLKCKIEDGGCGYTTTAKQPYCVFCGDGKEEAEEKAEKDADADAEATSTALAIAAKDNAIDGELIEDGEGLPVPAGDVLGSVADLDAAIDLVNERKRLVTGNEWDLGVAIFEIFRRSLYVTRKKAGGSPLYASWSQFCVAELGFSSATANRYMRIATCFTRDLAQDLGPSKLVELLPIAEAQAADEQIAKRLGREPKLLLPPLLERARVLPVNELRAEVRAAMPSRPQDKPGQTGRATAAAAAKKNAAKRPEKERVTVQRQEGTVKLRFYLSEKAARAADPKKAAKKLADGVVAVEPAVNGVEVVYTLKSDARYGAVLSRRIVRVE